MQTISDELSRLQVIELDAGQIFSGNPSGTPIKGYAFPGGTPVHLWPFRLWENIVCQTTGCTLELSPVRSDGTRQAGVR